MSSANKLTDKSLTLRISLVCLMLAIITSSGSLFAEDYYRWQDDKGVTHYGSTPPKGVDAVLVKTYGTSKPAIEQPNSNTGEPAVDPERQRRLTEQQSRRCDEERQRLATLQQSTRVRMENANGDARYLTQEEIDSEITTTQRVIDDICK